MHFTWLDSIVVIEFEKKNKHAKIAALENLCYEKKVDIKIDSLK